MKVITQDEKKAVRAYVEVWATSEINKKWCVPDELENNDPELIDMVIRDIGVTVQPNLFVFFPNYARLLVIKALDWHDQLSTENIAHVVKALLDEKDDYVFDQQDYLMIAREAVKTRNA